MFGLESLGIERFRFSSPLGRQGEARGWARHSAATAGVYTEVHEHRIAEVKAFAALYIFKGE
jgi:hypothetical protein